MTMLDDHHSVGVAMAPAFVPAVIAMLTPAVITMLAEFGARAEMVMVAALDHDGFGAGNRRRRDGQRQPA